MPEDKSASVEAASTDSAAQKGRQRSLRAKLVRTMIAMLFLIASATLLVVAAMSARTASTTLDTIQSHLRDAIVHKGTALVTLQAVPLRDMAADNAFGDVNRLVERTAKGDREITYGLFVGEDLKPWAFSAPGLGKLDSNADPLALLGLDGAVLRKPGTRIAGKTVLHQSVIEFSVPVLDDKGTFMGALVYAISERPLQEALAQARSRSSRALVTTVVLLLMLGAVTMIVGVVLSRTAASRITRPIVDLTSAVNVLASGRRDIRVSIESGDEIELLGSAFNHMAGELEDSYCRLEQMNRTLEQKVQDRTRELAERNRGMRLVLDNVNQGLLTISATGRLASERSATVDKWFGDYEADTAFFRYMERIDQHFAQSFALSFELLIEDVLPRELCLYQMPTRIRHQGREYRCSYSAILRDDVLQGLLVIIDDITEELARAQREGERKELLAMFEALTSDRSGFLAFVDEATEIVGRLTTTDIVEQKRALHTLKGNAFLVGLTVLGELCHAVEDEIGESSTLATEASIAPIKRRWEALMNALRGFLGDKGRDVVELTIEALEALEEAVRKGLPAPGILDRLASWRLESAETPLRRLANYAQALSARLAKGKLDIAIEAHDLYLSPKKWAGLWTDMVHVVRNAVDHGIEATAQREALGKGVPHIKLAASIDRSGERPALLIEVEDDGAGIAWERVREVAAMRGMPHNTRADLERAIFADGVTTRTEVSTVSGRGVGLAALWERAHQLGGAITIKSVDGKGACFRFRFPLAGIGPQLGVELRRAAA